MSTGIFIALFVITFGVLYFLWSWFRWLRYGHGESQHELAELLAQAATNELRFGDEFDSGIALYVVSQSWSKKEQARRLLHAASLLVRTFHCLRLES
jgi:hypothetical protein